MSQSGGPIRVGTVEVKPLPITVQREPEVGSAWETCCNELGFCALGKTPGEAADNLGNARPGERVVNGVPQRRQRLGQGGQLLMSLYVSPTTSDRRVA